jgi:hypothetical protein
LIPQISIQSQRGLIGVESERGQFEIRRPTPVLHVQSTRAVVHADNGPGDLRVDQSMTNNALTGGKPEDFWQHIYSQYKQIAQQNIQEIVGKGNRLGNIVNRDNPIPELAMNDFIEGAPDIQVFGFASPVNIAIQYTPNDVNIHVVPGHVDIEAQVQRPEIEYHRGSIKVYMQQYPKVTITPPEINIIA